jgi:hypothetical protein
LTDIKIFPQIPKFMKIVRLGTKMFHVDARNDGYHESKSCFSLRRDGF